jgi:predicted nucleic acid-binding protein
VSAASFAEIRFGIELVTDAGRRAALNDWLAHKVRPMFEGRLLAITEDVMFKRHLLVEDGRKVGRTFSQPDLIIAATALHHGTDCGVSRCESVSKSACIRAQSMDRSAAGSEPVTVLRAA